MATQRIWIENRLIPGAGKGTNFFTVGKVGNNRNSGEINLRPETGELGSELVKGNVYFDDQPVCDDDWGSEEAKVACR